MASSNRLLPDRKTARAALPVKALQSPAAHLQAIVDGLHQEEIRVGDLLGQLGEEGLGLTLLIVSVAALVPWTLPVGWIFGVIFALVAAQIASGSRKLYAPGWLAHRTVKCSYVATVVKWTAPWLYRAERVLKPRLTALTAPPMRSVLAGLSWCWV